MNDTEKAFFFQAAARCICGSLELEQTIGDCYQLFKNYFPLDDLYYTLFDQEKSTLRVMAKANASGVKKMHHIIRLPMLPKTELKMQTKLMVSNGRKNDPEPKYIEYVESALGLPESSSMILPLLPDGVRIGAFVTMRKSGENFYSDLHAELFTMLHDLFAVSLSNALKHEEVIKLKDMLADDNRYLIQELRQLAGEDIIGAESGLKSVMALVRKVAIRNNPVLLLGETGVGKELIANAIHYSSLRKDGPFIKVNSGAIPETLIDSELFGHEKGAFTGAVAQKRGRFERAQGGTIFLDEIGDLPLQAQIRLLRVVQQKELERVGGTETIPVDARIIVATHRDLEQMVSTNKFREDLWYRLNVFPIIVPPLRQRRADIPALVEYFLKRKSRELNFQKIPFLAPGATDSLMDYPWKGNVRELENMVERALIQYSGGLISFDPFIIPQNEDKPDIANMSREPLLLDVAMAHHIRAVLKTTKGKVSGRGGAAQLMGIHPSTLRLRMDNLGIPYRRKEKVGRTSG